MLIQSFFRKKSFKVENIFMYSWEKKNSNLNVFKYYFFDIIIQYNYLIIYIIWNLYKTKGYLTFFKTLLSRIINFIFIYLFGFPIFFIDVTNKLYTRLKNSFKNFRVDSGLFLLNLNSMYFFDFSNHFYIEELEITF